jgi:hypothetical protein
MDSANGRERVGVIVIHGVGETDSGWCNKYIVERLQQRCPALKTEPFSEFYQLDDRGRTKAGSLFPAYVRRGTLGAKQTVAFIELYWADLSKTGAGPFYFMLATLRLFYEAPFILAHSFMHQSKSGYHHVLKQLILMATWILRWPIAGMNTTALVCSLIIIGLHHAKLLPAIPLGVTLCASLALLAVTGLFIARRRLHHDLWLTDVSLATALFSCLAIAFIIALNALLPARLLASPDAYLAFSLPPIFGIWVFWSIIIAAAIAMLIPVYLKRLFGYQAPTDFPLARPAAALSLVLLQGLIWKVFVTLPSAEVIKSIAIIRLPTPAVARTPGVSSLFIGDDTRCTAPAFDAIRLLCDAFGSDQTAALRDAVRRLDGVFVFNSLLALYTMALFVLLVIVRTLIIKTPGLSLVTMTRWMPRVILSQAIAAFLFFGSLLNLVVYWEQLYESEFFLNNVPGIKSIWLGPTLFAVVISILYFFNIFQVITSSIVHIFRDVVDHHYYPRFDRLKFVMPKAVRTKNEFPRRARIQERMNVLVETLVRDNQFDRIVLVAHSQGAVILYDYLGSKEDEEDLSRTSRLDVVTVGSPLTHLYQYYFDEYSRKPKTVSEMNAKLASWTNLWRVDDPIGNRTVIGSPDFVTNIELPPGGHIDYWREARVIDVILGLIAPDHACETQPSSQPPREAPILANKVAQSTA